MKVAALHFDKNLYPEYSAEIQDQRLAFSRSCACVGIVLILLGGGLDYILYPDMMMVFVVARIACALLVLMIVFLLRTKWGKERAHWLTLTWLLLPQIMIAWMISATEGVGSPYNVGLHLAIYASGIALPFSIAQSLILGGWSLVLYLFACAVHSGDWALRGAFFVNSFFILFAVAVSVVCTFFNERARFMLFRLKDEVARKNAQMNTINQDLALIKGQMLQQEKMAAIGTLAAGLIHEVNNPVNFCLMAIDVGLEEVASGNNAILHECLLDAKQGMKRVQHIVSDLKTFAYRKAEVQVVDADFSFEAALDTAVRLTRHEFTGVAITRDLPSDTRVSGDGAAIIGVLINLLSNAALAMRNEKKGSVIHVSARWVENHRLKVTVRDDGPGIRPENLSRVFEPFFTTREVGQGLGLGLSISYRIIEQHGGSLIAESMFGEWAQMIFDLPGAT